MTEKAQINPALIVGPYTSVQTDTDYWLTLQDAMGVAKAWADREFSSPAAALKACLTCRPLDVIRCDDGFYRYASHVDAIYYILLQACSTMPKRISVNVKQQCHVKKRA